MSEAPERFCLHWRGHEPTMEPDPIGAWVRYFDYAALEQLYDEILTEVWELREQVGQQADRIAALEQGRKDARREADKFEYEVQAVHRANSTLEAELARLREALTGLADQLHAAWNIDVNDAEACIREWGGHCDHGVQARVRDWEMQLRALAAEQGEPNG